MHDCFSRNKEETFDNSAVELKLSPPPSDRCYTYCLCCSVSRSKSVLRSCVAYHRRNLAHYTAVFVITLSLMGLVDAWLLKHQNRYLNSWLILRVLLLDGGNKRSTNKDRFLIGQSRLQSRLSAAVIGATLLLTLHCSLSVALTHGFQWLWMKMRQISRGTAGFSADSRHERRQSSSSNGALHNHHHHPSAVGSKAVGGHGHPSHARTKHIKRNETLNNGSWRRSKAEEFERTRRQRKRVLHSHNGSTIFGLSSGRRDFSISTTVDDRSMDSLHIRDLDGSSQDDDEDEELGEDAVLQGRKEYHRCNQGYFQEQRAGTKLHSNYSGSQISRFVHHKVIEDEGSNGDRDPELGDRFEVVGESGDHSEDDHTRVLHAGGGLTITVGGGRSSGGNSGSDSAGGTLARSRKKVAKMRHSDSTDEGMFEDSGVSAEGGGGRSPLSSTDDEKLLGKPKVQLVSSKGRDQGSYLSVAHLSAMNNRNGSLRETSLTGASDLTGLTYL